MRNRTLHREDEKMETSLLNQATIIGDKNLHSKSRIKQTKEAISELQNGTFTLLDGELGQTYMIKEINTDDDEMNAFLFRLGCYEGEPVTIISKKRKSCTIVIKNGRYNIDAQIAKAIII